VVDPGTAEANAALHGLPRSRPVDLALRTRPVPAAPVRAAQRLAMKAGALSYERGFLTPLARARREALGDGAGPPRLLVRVDEFPDSAGLDDPRLGYEASARFHDLMASAGVAHLLAIVPQWTFDPRNPIARGGRKLDDRDVELLQRMRGQRVAFAQHGTTHRTRHPDPRRHSELCGLDDDALAQVLEAGRRALAEVDITTRVLVPPHNRFDASQWPALAARYDVVTGGPESVVLFGFHGGPLWRGDAVYLPCYPPLYGRAETVLAAVQGLLRDGVSGWVPIVLHMGWELHDHFASLRRLAAAIAPYAVDWEAEFLPALDASRPGGRA
jgi:hypothetical protein